MAPKRKPSSQHPTLAPSSGGLQSSQPSTSSLPQIRFTRVWTDQIHDDTRRDRSGGPNLQPTGVPSTSRSSSRSRDSKRRTSPERRLTRDPGGNPHSNLLDPPNPPGSTPTTPDLSTLRGWGAPLFRPLRGVDNPHSAPITYPIHDPDAILRAQREYPGMGIVAPPPPEPASSSSAVPAGDRKKTVLSTTKLLLQTASSALKISPIPYVSQILDLLLTLLQAYETVDSNNESLKGLNDEVRKAYTAILRPLELYAGQTVPPELIAPLKEFHDTLEEQINRIEFLKHRGLFKRMVTASNIAKDISDVKACINKAITSVSTEASVLTLMQTIRASVESELSRLKRAPAEHTYVKSKSECLPTTQVKAQNSIFHHLKDTKARFVWLRGSPGTGKTAIAMSIASALKVQGTLAASFFWDKNQVGTGLDSIELFPSTLAHQLACFDREFMMSLVRCLRQQDLQLPQYLSLEKQMKALVIEPMRNLLEILPSGKDRLVIVLDGLDECGDLEALEHLMELVLILEELPATFTVFVSCRPESLVMSAWDEARERGLVIPCEDVDIITKEEKHHTIRCMVEDGLRDRIKKSRWKPSEEDFDAFTLACRELPVMASIRIREVISQTRHGRTLQTEFRYLLNLSDPPTNLNLEYLRILRRAYMPDSSAMPADIAKMYRLLVGTILVAGTSLSVYSMSELLGIAKDEAQATLEPISSIIELPSKDWRSVKFYHATAEEFITGSPIGNENDKVFFINDKKGYFLGPLLLRIFNNCCKRNEFRIPTNPPLSDKGKWADFKRWNQPDHIRYVIRTVLYHLDPAKLFSQESNDNELQDEFNSFLTQNLLTFLHIRGTSFVPTGFDEFNNHDVIELLRESAAMNGVHQWLLYRSMSLFCPPKSSLYKLYGHLSDPVRIFGISSKISNHLIPLSEASLNARMLIEAKLDGLPKKVDKWSREVIDYEAEFREPDVRNGIVTCAALSRDGRYIALGLGSGIIEIADIDDQRTISQFQNDPPNPPAWIEFNHGHHRVTTEDVNGNIAIYSHGVLPVKLGTLPIGAYPVVTAVSDSGFFIIRVLRDPGKPWYNNVARIYILGDRHIQLLASPPLDSSIPSSQPSKPAFPERHTIAFSPGARYIAAFDGYNAFTWSTESGDFITHYDIRGDKSWIINPGMAPTCPYHIPHPVSTRPTLPLAGDTISAHHSWVDARPDSDESWIKRPFFHPLPKHGRGYSFAAGKTPLVNAFYIPQSVWFNGGPQLTVPREYYVSVGANSTNGIQRWYGDQLINNINNFYRPQSSKDGTRFLLQGQMKAPIVVDIGQAAWYPSATFDFPVPNSYSPCSTASDISSPHETSDSP